MRALFRIYFLLIVLGIILAQQENAGAFSLLGPYQPWMEETNGFHQPGDIGGPMSIGNGYRWNVPVVTYGFDPSFIAFFGTNGEAAVESAIQIISNLPPASDVVLTNYPFDGTMSSDAQAIYKLDLKSGALSLLLEQMGLAQPTRYVFAIRQWNAALTNAAPSNPYYALPGSFYPEYISELNYDPQTFDPSLSVNGTLYSGVIYTEGGQNFLVPMPLDSTALTYTAVADQQLINENDFAIGDFATGEYYTGLTYDDVGGLRYLYSTNNINFETLLQDVQALGANTLVNGALRPGVNKISFIPQAVSSTGGFLPTTNYFTDTYISNAISMQQSVMRITLKPDFLFCAGDVSASVPMVPYFAATGTTNWINNSTLNGNNNGAGPGMIQPPVKIVFNKLGEQYYRYGTDQTTEPPPLLWASFDNSTNPLISYPVPQSGSNQMTFRMWVYYSTEFQKCFTWNPISLTGSQFAFQTSTDLVNWATLFNVTNNSSVCTYLNEIPLSGSQFYRLVQQ